MSGHFKNAEPSLNAQLPETQEDIQQMYTTPKRNSTVSNGYFWDGFEKAAAARVNLGMKAPVSSGRLRGLKPTSGVATASAFKPNKLPVPKPVAAVRNTEASILKQPAAHKTHNSGKVSI